MNKVFSAIDIGSNAIRMMVAEFQNEQLSELKKLRSPIRLGQDVFSHGEISNSTIQKAIETFKKFAEINKKFNVQNSRAVATSATREAKNKMAFVQKIYDASGIKIEVIDGDLEANLIFKAVNHSVDLSGKNALLIDIGGGSVEVTLTQGSRIRKAQSFPLGTVRILDFLKKRNLGEANLKIVIGDQMSPLSKFLEKNDSGTDFDFAVGTGGNFECMARLKMQLLHKSPVNYLTLDELVQISEKLKNFSVKERIEKLKLREDRADVILPALYVTKTVLRQAGAKKLLVPGVGLRDGILWSLVE